MSEIVTPSLALEDWIPTTFDHMVLVFLAAEWRYFPAAVQAKYDALVMNPSLQDQAQNRARFQILRKRRQVILAMMPGDTRWFLVKYLRRQYIPCLRAINHRAWRSADDANELPLVALRMKRTLKGHPAKWAPPILWGHERNGPLTIIEGNNRLTALTAATDVTDFTLPVLVGLSPTSCRLHLPDIIGATLFAGTE